MIITKELKTLEDFQSLKKGDIVACEFNREIYDYPKKTGFKFKVFEIYEGKHRTTEIILQKKNNIYFNYSLVLDPTLGPSILKSAIQLIVKD